MTTPTWHQGVREPILKGPKPPDPVYQTTGGWYYCDECWADSFGPFATEDEARESLRGYVVGL